MVSFPVPLAAMGFSASPPHFRAREAEQLAMVDGAASRLREYRRLLPSGDLADALDGRFWDAVVLTAANERQALVYARQLDGLHARGQLPGSRDRYVVFPDPPGPRVGSGGATLNVMLRLQASVGQAWASRRILLLHAGGYSERSPAHGTLGKAFGQLPMDAAGVGVPATILEAQLVYLQDLPAALPPGVFVSSADVVLQMARVPPIDERVRERVADGILALGHASPIEIGVGHGVFACDRTELTEFVRRHAAADANDASLRSGTLACLRCLQKPSEAAQRDAGAVMPSPAAMGLPGGGGAEWVLTDSAFHVGWRACDALVRVAAAEPRTFAGVEVCAYGDFMQPMGEDADDAYLGRVDHVASLAGSAGGTNEAAGSGTDGMIGNGTDGNGGTASAASAPADPSPAGRLRAARASLARALRGKPLLVLPLLPSRFVHVGTMPELLQHCARDHDVLAALPAAPGGVALGSWDPACMEVVPGGGSVGADGVWGGGRSSAPGSCLLASTLGRGVRVGAGSLIAHCDVGSVTVVGEGCLLHDVDVPKGSVVPPGTFLHCVPLGGAAAAAAGIEPAAVPSDRANSSDESTASCWTCLALDVTDEVKRPGKSTLFGVPVEEAARRLGLDPETGDAAWSSDEPRTTTLARLFPVCATAEEATASALHLRATVTRDRLLVTRTDAAGAADERAGLRVSVGEALRSLANHPAAVSRRDALRRRAVAKMVARLLERNTPTERWLHRAPPLRCLVAARSGDDEASATARAMEAAALAESGGWRIPGGIEADAGPRRALAAGRIALALAPAPPHASAATKAAEATARRCLRAAIVGPFVDSPPAFGRPAAAAAACTLPPAPTAKTMAKQSVLASVRAEYPARLNLAGGWTDTPPYSLERRGAVLHVAVLTAESAPPRGGGAGNPPGAGAEASGAGAGGATNPDATNSDATDPDAEGEKTPTAAGDASSNASNAASVSSAGRLRRPISATATRLPGASGIVRLVSEPSPGVPGRSEEIKTVEELLTHDDPAHPFALARACASLALVPSRLDAGLGGVSSVKPSRARETLADALRAFLGAPGFGLEIRTRVDLPRGSGLGTSSILGLAILHATHELSTGRAWTPGDAESGAGAARWAGRSAIVPHPESKHADEASRARAEAGAEAATEARESVSWPSARVAFNAVLAVEQLMTTGGGWQDQIGGALEGARLTVSVPGDFGAGKGTAEARPNVTPNATPNVTPNVTPGDVSPPLRSLPEYEPRVAALPPAAAAFLSRHVACVFTGACRLAATVARGVVDAWQRRVVGVEDTLRACAAVGAEMTDALDRLGALPNDSFVGVGSEAARAELDALGNALERHKAMQEKLWPSITSPTVRALYDAVAPLARGSHICGAGNGGHVVVFLAAGKTPADVAAAVAGVAEAPEAKVVRVQMMLGGGVRKVGGGAETGPNKRQRTG